MAGTMTCCSIRLSLAIVAIIAAGASASISVTLPLQGNYRVGRYMPIHITADACQRLTIEGDGVMPVTIDARGQAVDAVFPLLIVATPGAIIASDDKGNRASFTPNMNPLGDDQRLIGTVGDAKDGAGRLFPGKSSALIALDPVNAISGAPVAWEILDVVVSQGPIPGADVTTYRPLLGSGVTFAVLAGSAPNQTWPWRKDGPWWVLRYEALGPRSALDAEAAYLPARGWTAGTPWRTRATVLAIGVIVMILMLAATLLRGRIAIVALAVVVAGSLAAVAAWSRRQPLIRQVDSGVFITAGPLLQYDLWQYQTTAVASDTTLAWFGNTRPMSLSPQQITRQRLTLECFANGYGRQLTARLEPHEILATMSKNVAPEKLLLPTDQATDSPIHALVRAGYLVPGVRIIGQSTLDRGDEAYWPPVVLEVTTP
jgi:hypothetical protein